MQHNSQKSHTLFIHMWMLEIRLRLDFVCLIVCLVLVLTDGKSYREQICSNLTSLYWGFVPQPLK